MEVSNSIAANGHSAMTELMTGDLKIVDVVGSERQLFEKKLNCFAFAVCKCARAASFLAHA